MKSQHFINYKLLGGEKETTRAVVRALRAYGMTKKNPAWRDLYAAYALLIELGEIRVVHPREMIEPAKYESAIMNE
jgi:hypothetical protein